MWKCQNLNRQQGMHETNNKSHKVLEHHTRGEKDSLKGNAIRVMNSEHTVTKHNHSVWFRDWVVTQSLRPSLDTPQSWKEWVMERNQGEHSVKAMLTLENIIILI